MGKDRESRELMRSILAANLEAASKPSKKDREAARRLAFLCFVGAFLIAGWLVIQGPPEMETEPTAVQAASDTSPAPPAGKGATDDSAGAENTTPGSKADSTAGDEQGGGEGATSDEIDEGSNSALNEEAPWVFAIVALLVGAFLAGGQSLGLGGGGAAPKGESGATES